MFCLIGGWWLCLIRMSPWCGRQAGCTHLFRSHCWTSVTGSHPAPQDSRKCSHALGGHVLTEISGGTAVTQGRRMPLSLQSLPQFTPPATLPPTPGHRYASARARLWWRVAVFSRRQCSFTQSRSKLTQVLASPYAVSNTQRRSWVAGWPQRRAHGSLPQWSPVDVQVCPDRWPLKRSSAGTGEPAGAGAFGAAFTAPDCSSSAVRDRGCDEARRVRIGQCWAWRQSGRPWACRSVFADTFGR